MREEVAFGFDPHTARALTQCMITSKAMSTLYRMCVCAGGGEVGGGAAASVSKEDSTLVVLL